MKKCLVIAFVLAAVFVLQAKESTSRGSNNLSNPLFLTPRFCSVGGPDSFGYEWIDSHELWGPVFTWIDISGTGTEIVLGDDDVYWGIPFEFIFYGTFYDSVAVQSNGAVSFSNEVLSFNNNHIPDTLSAPVTEFIAIYWDDLDPGYGGAVYYQVMGDTLIVQFDSIQLHDYYEEYIQTFEVLLIGSSGDIIVQYLRADHGGREATIGIQGSPVQPPLWGLEYSHNSISVHPQLAIRFSTSFVKDVGTVAIEIDTPLPESTTIAPVAIVKNFGTLSGFFDVCCTIEPGGYSASTVAYVTPGDSTPVAFSPSFTFKTGPYTVTVNTDLADDENHANDTLVKIIETYAPGIAEENSGVLNDPAFTVSSICMHGKINAVVALPAAAHVDLEIYDALGRSVRRPVSDAFSAGTHRLSFDLDLPAGVYFYRLTIDNCGMIVKKVMHIH